MHIYQQLECLYIFPQSQVQIQVPSYVLRCCFFFLNSQGCHGYQKKEFIILISALFFNCFATLAKCTVSPKTDTTPTKHTPTLFQPQLLRLVCIANIMYILYLTKLPNEPPHPNPQPSPSNHLAMHQLPHSLNSYPYFYM